MYYSPPNDSNNYRLTFTKIDKGEKEIFAETEDGKEYMFHIDPISGRGYNDFSITMSEKVDKGDTYEIINNSNTAEYLSLSFRTSNIVKEALNKAESVLGNAIYR